MTKCRECGAQVSTEADNCPICGMKNPSKSKEFKRIAWEWFIVITVGSVIWQALQEKPKSKTQYPICSVEKVDVEPFMFVLKDELDAGFIVTSHVKNSGPSGTINSNVRLSTSEGDYQHNSIRVINSGETQIVRIDFPEPTINAANVQAHATCEP
jgi:hypothetical protein